MNVQDTIQVVIETRTGVAVNIFKGWDYLDYFGTIRRYGWWFRPANHTLAHYLGANQYEALESASVLKL